MKFQLGRHRNVVSEVVSTNLDLFDSGKVAFKRRYWGNRKSILWIGDVLDSLSFEQVPRLERSCEFLDIRLLFF